MLCGGTREVVERGAGVRALLGGHESEMAGRNADACVARHGTEHTDVGLGAGPAHFVGVPRRPGLVEDDARDVEARVERAQPVNDSRNAPARRGDVDDEDDRRLCEPSDVSRRGETVRAESTVEKAHDTFDDGNVRRVRLVGPGEQKRRDAFLTLHPRIEVAPDAPRGERVVAGVDEVRADLGRRHVQPARGQRGHDTDADRRLALPRRGRSEDDAREHV